MDLATPDHPRYAAPGGHRPGCHLCRLDRDHFGQAGNYATRHLDGENGALAEPRANANGVIE